MYFYFFIFLLSGLFSESCFASITEAKNIAILPYAKDTAFSIYQYNATLADHQLNFWQLAEKAFLRKNITFRPTDLMEFTCPQGMTQIQKDTCCIICTNLPEWIVGWKEKLKIAKQHCPLILYAYEPPSFAPTLYTQKTLSLFSKVLTWNDDLVDNKKFFKCCYPVLHPQISSLVPFTQKKLLTQMSANKKSHHPDELYSERLNVIRYFEKRPGNDFEFYGPSWQKGNKKYRNYRGAPINKIEVLKQYRFSICYENMKNIKGYITEKIFDCFRAGCVPVYWGASNITEYIPLDCFIDRRSFASMDALVTFLRNMREEEYNQYIKNIQIFLKSEKAQAFTHEAFKEVLINALCL